MQVDFDSLSFEVSEASIAEASGLSTEGDQWFKKFPFEVDLNQFLLPRHENLDWSKAIHQSQLKEKWREILSIIQRYITFEGRFPRFTDTISGSSFMLQVYQNLIYPIIC